MGAAYPTLRLIDVATKRASEKNAEWREFELLVAKIERVIAPQGAVVKSPDMVKDYYSKNKRGRDVDASIRYRVGTIDILITIECRARRRSQDETWIEQMATKKTAIRASRTVAVSSRGFSEAAHEKARMFDIELRTISEITADDIAGWADINCMFTNKKQVNFMKFHCQLQCEDVSGIDVVEEVKQDQQERNVQAKFIRFGDTMMGVDDLIQSWQHHFKGTEKDLFYEVELNGPPVPKQVYFTFKDDGVRIKTNKGELPLRSILIEVEVTDLTVRVPPARIYRYSDENNQLAQGVDFIFPDCTPIIVSIIKYDSGEFKMQVQNDSGRFNGREYVVIQPPDDGAP